MSAPPRAARLLLRVCLPSGLLGRSIAGDLWQDYADLRRRRSQTVAHLWFWVQAVRVGLPFLRSRTLGCVSQRFQAPRGHQGGSFMQRWSQEFRNAWRGLRRSPLTAVLAVLMIALGMGAAASMFSIVNGVLLTPLDIPDPQRLVSIIGLSLEDGVRHPFTVADYNDVRGQATTFSGIAARWSNTAALRGDDGAVEVGVGWVTPNYFEVLDVAPLAGNLLQEGESDAVLLGHGLWQRRFGGDRAVVGQSLDLGGRPMRIAGVLGPDIDPNLPTLDGTREGLEMWRLMDPSWLTGDNRVLAWLRVIGRIRPDVGLQQAQGELDTIEDRIASLDGKREEGDLRFLAMTAHDHLVQRSRPYLVALMWAVGFVLLVACANVANLLLAKAQFRGAELAVRSALGAGRADLFRQLLLESALVAATGGLAGILLALAVVSAAPDLLPAGLPRLENIEVDWTVLLFALLASTVTALLCGLVPAVRATRVAPADALGGRGQSRGRRPRRLSQGLVAAEVGLSLVLLVSGGLLLQNFAQLLASHPGFSSDHLLTFSLTPSGSREQGQGIKAFYGEFLDQVRALPGVEAAGHTNRMPLAGGVFGGNYVLTEADVDQPGKPPADFRYISTGFFAAMGTRLVSGRDFEPLDDGRVAVVDQLFSRTAWPGEEAVGKRLWTDDQLGQGGWSTVVGVVEHMRHETFAQDGKPTVFFPWRPLDPRERRHFALRTSVPPTSVADQVRRQLGQLDAGATLSRPRTMQGLVDDSIATDRFATVLVGAFALVALLMSAAGLYGVVSHSVSGRTREMGIRIALGADRRRLLRLVLAEGLGLSLVGALLGLLVWLATSQLITSLLSGITSADPAALAAAVAVVTALGLLGSYLPARRAMRTDPIECLRSE